MTRAALVINMVIIDNEIYIATVAINDFENEIYLYWYGSSILYV